MANNIKGITIEIGGDTTPLNKALKNVNDTSKNLQDELKEVNKQLKFDPKNTELLNQKQSLLTKEISNTNEKLETLKTAEAQAQEQFKKGKISEEQYRALEREIIKTESQLKNLEKQAGQSNAALNKVSNVTGDFSKSADKMGKSLIPVSAAAVAVGTAAVAAFNEVDEGADTAIAKTGATGESAKQLEATYKDVASSVPESFDDVGNAVGEVGVRFEFTGNKLKTASEDFLKFAKINNVDVNSSIELVQRAMANAGIKSDDYNKVLDMLTVAAQKSGISIETLTEHLTKYGAPMKALGFDTQTSISIFAGWEKAGVNTEVAFSGMQKAVAKWSKEGKDSRTEFTKTLDEIKKCPNITSATQKAVQTFGTKAGPELAQAIRSGKFSVDEYIKALQNAGGTVDKTYSGIVDGTDDAKTAMNAAKVAASELGGTIMEMVAPILKDIASKAKELASKFAGLDDNTKKTIVTILGIVAVIAPALLIAGKIAGLISAVTGAMAMMKTATLAQTAAQYGLNAALLASPVTWIVIGIAALVAIFIVLWKRCEGFRNFWIGMWNGIKGIFSASIDFIKNNWKELALFLVNPIAGSIALLYKLNPKFRQWVNNLGKDIKTGFNNGITWIKNLPSEALQWGKDMLDGFIKGIQAKFGAIGEAAKGVGAKIKKFLHFSKPEEGDLRDYETWMPDFMEGLANSIEKSKYKVIQAIQSLSSGMSLNASNLLINSGAASNKSGTSTVNHTGVITVKGVNNEDQTMAVVNIVLDELTREMRLV